MEVETRVQQFGENETESEEIIEKETLCLNQLKKLIQGDGDLMFFESFLDDRFLLHFVRGRKSDPERAFKTLQNYFLMRRTKYRELFLELIPSKLRFQQDSIRICKNLSPNGEVIGVNRVSWWGTDDFTIPADDFIRKGLIVLEEAWNQVEAERNGVIAILDASGFGIKHAKTIGTPYQIRKIIGVGSNSMPLRYKEVHFVNVPFYFTVGVNIAKRILPAKLGQRLHSHGYEMESLHKFLPPSILPEFLGGDLTEDEAYDNEVSKRINQKEDYYRRLAEKL